MPANFKRAIPRFASANAQCTVDFYSKILGFELAVTWPAENPKFIILERGSTRLAFDIVPGTPVQDLRSSNGFYLDTANVRALHEEIWEQVTVEWGPEVYSYGCREFAIRDPDGHLLVFTEATSDPPTCTVE